MLMRSPGGVPAYPVSIRWITQCFPVYTGSTSGIPMAFQCTMDQPVYTGSGWGFSQSLSVQWIAGDNNCVLFFKLLNVWNVHICFGPWTILIWHLFNLIYVSIRAITLIKLKLLFKISWLSIHPREGGFKLLLYSISKATVWLAW